MEPSKSCFDLIKHEEGCILHAYHGKADKPGVWTIGWGMTWYPTGKAVRQGETLTQDQADQYLTWHVDKVADAIDAHIEHGGITQSQFDALVSFAYNLGENALLTSTLWKKLQVNPKDTTIWNFTNRNGIPDIKSCEFLKWVYSDGKVVDDLIFRRAVEAKLYISGNLGFYPGH